MDTTAAVRQTASASLTDRFAGGGKTWDIVSLVDATEAFALGLIHDKATTIRQTAGTSHRFARIRGTRSTVTLPRAMLQFASLGSGYYALAVLEATGTL